MLVCRLQLAQRDGCVEARRWIGADIPSKAAGHSKLPEVEGLRHV